MLHDTEQLKLLFVWWLWFNYLITSLVPCKQQKLGRSLGMSLHTFSKGGLIVPNFPPEEFGNFLTVPLV